MSALLIFAGCTATRPRTLVRRKALLYEDIQFQVFPSSPGEQLPRVAISLNLKHTKRSGGEILKVSAPIRSYSLLFTSVYYSSLLQEEV
jgi:hypothetical protein